MGECRTLNDMLRLYSPHGRHRTHEEEFRPQGTIGQGTGITYSERASSKVGRRHNNPLPVLPKPEPLRSHERETMTIRNFRIPS